MKKDEDKVKHSKDDNKRSLDNRILDGRIYSFLSSLCVCGSIAWKKIKIICEPPLWVVMLGVPLAGALLAWAFVVQDHNHPLTYIAYVFSAYMLAAVCFRIARQNPLTVIKQLAYKNVHTGRYVDDRDFRAIVGARLSLAVDGFWALANLALGLYFSSAWYVTLAAYYIFHVVMRTVLVRHVYEVTTAENLRRAYKASRICGVLICFSTIVISGIVLLVITREGGFVYVGTMIYAVALYAFWALIASIMNFVTYHKHDNPILFTVMNVNLVTALVSIFALEIAMLAAFSTEGQYVFQMTMIGTTGAVIAAVDLGIGGFLIVRSTMARKR